MVNRHSLPRAKFCLREFATLFAKNTVCNCAPPRQDKPLRYFPRRKQALLDEQKVETLFGDYSADDSRHSTPKKQHMRRGARLEYGPTYAREITSGQF